MKTFLCVMLLSLLFVSPSVRADGPDDEYVGIYSLIEQGDALSDKGQNEAATAKYVEAQKSLKIFKKNYPDWNPKIVTYRLSYLAEKIATIPKSAPPVKSTNAPAAAPTNAPSPDVTEPAKPAPPPPSTDNENQIKGLQEQIYALQAGNALLQAKLKEALSAQPAAIDPREFAKAQEQINGLLKQNELLKAGVEESKSKVSPAVDATKTQRALADANQKAAQLEQANAMLALEKTALQTRLDKLSAPDQALAALRDENKNLKSQVADLQTKTASPSADALKLQQSLAEANRKAADLQFANASLVAEKESLQARIGKLSAPDPALAALRDENSVLKKQVTELQGKPATATAGGDLAQKLKAAQAQVASLQSDKEILRLEKIALQEQAKKISAASAPVAAPVPSPTPDKATATKITSLESQRDALQKSLDAANKDIAGRKKSPDAPARADGLTRQIDSLRARIDTLEARPTPYTAEELALLSKPALSLVAEMRVGAPKLPKELPPGGAVLLAEARRYFVAHDLDKAEAKYLEVLKLDPKNVSTLADLASIQLDSGRLPEAEKNINAALAADPNDDYALFVLGQLKFAQKNYDEAFNALSRAAQINPQNPKIQNFLGLTLSEKGLRGPAESAFRKALQFDPAFAEAHLNLAVVYVTQQPPLVELARWHYQKAMGLGHAPNPGLEALLNPPKAATASAQ